MLPTKLPEHLVIKKCFLFNSVFKEVLINDLVPLKKNLLKKLIYPLISNHH